MAFCECFWMALQVLCVQKYQMINAFCVAFCFRFLFFLRGRDITCDKAQYSDHMCDMSQVLLHLLTWDIRSLFIL